MPYSWVQSWRLCSLEARRWTYRLSGTFPRFSTSPAYARLEDSLGNELVHEAQAGADAEDPMEEFDVSLDVDLPIGETEINLELNIPDDASTGVGSVRFRLGPHATRKFSGGSLYPLSCLQTEEPAALTIENWDMMHRPSLLVAARLLRDLYTDTTTALAHAAAIGLEDDTYASLPIDTRPGSGVIVHRSAKRIMVYVAGSTTTTQLIAQAFQMTQGPRDFTSYESMQLWRDGADVVWPVMTAAGVDLTTPIVLIGHSMGGAIACAMACVLHATCPGRRIEVLTFGCPRPGGAKMRSVLRRGPSRHIRNHGDVIVRCCPHPDELGYLALLIPEPIKTKVQGWRTPDNCVTLTTAGALVDGNDNGVRLAQFAAVVAPWIAGGAIVPGGEHAMSEYVRRLESGL